jgi:hypothetical protein
MDKSASLPAIALAYTGDALAHVSAKKSLEGSPALYPPRVERQDMPFEVIFWSKTYAT